MIYISIQDDPGLSSDLSHTWSWDKELPHLLKYYYNHYHFCLVKLVTIKSGFTLAPNQQNPYLKFSIFLCIVTTETKGNLDFRMTLWIKPSINPCWCLHADTWTLPDSIPFNKNIYISHTYSLVNISNVPTLSQRS